MQAQGLLGIDSINNPSDHIVAACAGVLAAWKWHSGESVWLGTGMKPFHPFEFSC